METAKIMESEAGLVPDESLYAALIINCGNNKRLDLAEMLFDEMRWKVGDVSLPAGTLLLLFLFGV